MIFWAVVKHSYFYPALLEEIRAARDNMGKYTRKTSNDFEDTYIVKTKDYRGSLIKLMQEVKYKNIFKSIEVLFLHITSNDLSTYSRVLQPLFSGTEVFCEFPLLCCKL